MPPLVIAGGIAAAGALGGAAISANAAGSAAHTQAEAAQSAAQLQKQEADKALGLQTSQYNQGQAELQPFYQAGVGAEANLANLLGTLPPNASSIAVPGFTPLSTTSPGGSGGVGAKPADIPQNVWNLLGYNQQLALTNPNADTSGGIAQTGKPGDIPQGVWDKLDPAQQKQLLGVGQPHVTPGTTTGTGAPSLASYVNPDLGASGSLLKPYSEQFQAPTGVDEQNDPGYQFRLQQGQQALERSASARGGLLSGGTGKALTEFGQNFGSNEYQNVYNRALEGYQTRYNAYTNDQTGEYNKLAAAAGQGQIQANQLANNGSAFANNASQTLLTSGAQQAQQLNNAAAATASGYVGAGNDWAGGLNGATSNLLQAYLASLRNPSYSTPPYSPGSSGGGIYG